MIEALAGHHEDQNEFSGAGVDLPRFIDRTGALPFPEAGGFGPYENEENTRDVLKADVSKFFGSKFELKVGGDQEDIGVITDRFNGGAGQRIYIFNPAAGTIAGQPFVYRHRYYVDLSAPGFDRGDSTTWVKGEPLHAEPETENTSGLPPGLDPAALQPHAQPRLPLGGAGDRQLGRTGRGRHRRQLRAARPVVVGPDLGRQLQGLRLRTAATSRTSRPTSTCARSATRRSASATTSAPIPASPMPCRRRSPASARASSAAPPRSIPTSRASTSTSTCSATSARSVTTSRSASRAPTATSAASSRTSWSTPSTVSTRSPTRARAWARRSTSTTTSRCAGKEGRPASTPGVEVSARKRFTAGWQVYASYLWSELEGNYDGVFQASTGQLDPNINSAFDYADFFINADGKLSNDREHSVKVNGSYTFQSGARRGPHASAPPPTGAPARRSPPTATRSATATGSTT